MRRALLIVLFSVGVVVATAAATPLIVVNAIAGGRPWEYRLVGGTAETRGVLLVRPSPANATDDPSWGGVCADAFTSPDARVACRSLGYADASAMHPPPHRGRFGPKYVNASDTATLGTVPASITQARLDEVACTGREDRLDECRAMPPTDVECGSSGGSRAFVSLECVGVAPAHGTPGGGTLELDTPRQSLMLATAAALAFFGAPHTAMAMHATGAIGTARCAPRDRVATDAGARVSFAPYAIPVDDLPLYDDLPQILFIGAIVAATLALNFLLCVACVSSAARQNDEDQAMRAHAGDGAKLHVASDEPQSESQTVDFRTPTAVSATARAAAFARFPGAWLCVVLWAYQAIAYLSAQLFLTPLNGPSAEVNTDAEWRIVAACVGGLFCLLLLLYVYTAGAKLARDSVARERAFVEYSEFLGGGCSCARMVLPPGFWHSNLEPHVARHGSLLDAFGARAMPWTVGWGLLRALFVAGAAAAVPSADPTFGCVRVNVVLAIGMGVAALAYLVVRPHRAPVDNAAQVVITVCGGLIALHHAAMALEDHDPEHPWLESSRDVRAAVSRSDLYWVVLSTGIVTLASWGVLFAAERSLRPFALRAKAQRLNGAEEDGSGGAKKGKGYAVHDIDDPFAAAPPVIPSDEAPSSTAGSSERGDVGHHHHHDAHHEAQPAARHHELSRRMSLPGAVADDGDAAAAEVYSDAEGHEEPQPAHATASPE
uniref:SRCR domain-containing protein n=1 Tax=Neobodo designis TaxID=312471 RepID=A0A7S1Q4E4_NEODS|mmetsp:Transcript_327/g.1285  ORF Transcript_327/g.1285 Transcript_327/m.1285 type:complete len:717 (+) Transcript_327:150-2300(+)|eukprot:CAMPEP_0174842248 /NCGR_PEP_ID=MMETSP1114-20130205/9789_1 /TAXON_ID=312471 /ORGANISM="Neobodo designis, Strain CCAP 1951/1" /LENGTH=716 /DNA_ID=CAMNT_0016076445 /DNA_START=149 /DNA_END=2299 /DNA_ORIENTATION=+